MIDSLVKSILVLLVAILAKESLILALLGVLIIILLFDGDVIERFDAEEKKVDDSVEAESEPEAQFSQDTDKVGMQEFRSQYCKDNKLFKDEKEVEDMPSSVEEHFEQVEFIEEPCNPCDESCKFRIMSQAEIEKVKELMAKAMIESQMDDIKSE